jgi:hypothetical protein
MSEQLSLFFQDEQGKGESVPAVATVSGLTKSAFVKGWQCDKLLWLYRHEPDAPEWVHGPIHAFKIEEGDRVGLLARQRFPDGVLVNRRPQEKRLAVEETAALVARNVPAIFEAAFERDGVHVRVDVMENLGNGRWRAIEVKSANGLKDRYKPDLFVQWWVLSGTGIHVEGIDLMRLNPACRFPDLRNLFVRDDMTDLARKFEGAVAGKVRHCGEVLALPGIPDIAPGFQCRMDGEKCPFLPRCEGERPADHVMHLYHSVGKKMARELLARKIHSMKAIPEETPLTPIHWRQVESVKTGKVQVDKDRLAGYLGQVAYPLYYLDFETIEPSIPRYPRTGPNRQVAVQFSCHIRSKAGRMEHREYLCESSDPLPEFADALLEAVGEEGSIAVYYADFERSRIEELADALPDRRERLRALVPRLWDLCEVTRETVYHPDFMGSFSIKKTLPVLVPGNGYDNLAIADGGAAMLGYAELTDPSIPTARRDQLRRDLLAYCRQDTQAMVDIHRKLIELAD